MGYQLGVDIGTTHIAAAVLRQGRAEVVALGEGTDAIPSVVFVDADDGVMVGEAASERGFSDATRVARAVKRRWDDAAPLVLGGRPYPVEDLTAKMLRGVVGVVSERQGEAPELVTVTHPAYWEGDRLDRLHKVFELAGLDDVRTVSEGEAAAMSHASVAGAADGDVVVVYDLGGGAFGAWVGRRRGDAFEVLGSRGVDTLGGMDFDQAVLAHVSSAVGVGPEALQADDPATVGAMDRLREECAVVKQTLSTMTEVSVPVFVPGGQSEIRITRDDLEGMVRPALTQTVEVLRHTLGEAHVEAADVATVVLVGGSSRIPMVAGLVSDELGQAVTVADRPQHAAALGAALSMVGLSAATHDSSPSAVPDPSDEGDPAEAPAGAAGGTPATEATVVVAASTAADTVAGAEGAAPSAGPGRRFEEVTQAASDVAVGVGETATPETRTSPTPTRTASSLSLLMSLAAVAVTLAVIGAAVAAGRLIAVGRVAVGIGLVVVGAAAAVGLVLLLRVPDGGGSPAPEGARASEAPSS